jgi:hypothetical protein
MPCNCGKNKRVPWQPRAARSRAAAPPEGDPQPAGRVVTPQERGAELANGARPPRAKQPTG